MTAIRELKERVWGCNMELPRLGLVKHTFGNVSGIDRSRGLVAIKPSGIPYEKLTIDDITVVDLGNKTIEGALRPSSDLKTHLLLYKSFPLIGGIVHTHSTYATAWAQAVKPIPILGTTHADILDEDVPCTAVMTDRMIKGEYEEETGRQILRVFKKRSYEDVPMVLVAGHGPFTWGESPEKALYHSLMLEEIARMALLRRGIEPRTPRLRRDSSACGSTCRRKWRERTCTLRPTTPAKSS